MKPFLLCSLLVAALAPNAPAIVYTTNFTAGYVVPDNNFSGVADARMVTAPAGTINAVAVSLNLTGGWNGDLYAYLAHDTGFSVLLNRVGPGTYGYGDAGMNVTLADNGTVFGTPQGNINNYQTVLGGPGVPTGLWNPENTSGSLGSFTATAPSGTWTLYIADLSGGGVTTVQSWGLQMDIVAVPEVESWIAAALAGAFGAFWLNRQLWGHKKPALA